MVEQRLDQGLTVARRAAVLAGEGASSLITWPTLSIRRSSASARKLPAWLAAIPMTSRSTSVRVAVVTGRLSAQVTSYGASGT